MTLAQKNMLSHLQAAGLDQIACAQRLPWKPNAIRVWNPKMSYRWDFSLTEEGGVLLTLSSGDATNQRTLDIEQLDATLREFQRGRGIPSSFLLAQTA